MWCFMYMYEYMLCMYVQIHPRCIFHMYIYIYIHIYIYHYWVCLYIEIHARIKYVCMYNIYIYITYIMGCIPHVTQYTCNILGCIPQMEKPKAIKYPPKRCAILWQFQLRTISVTSMSSESSRGDEHHVTFSHKFHFDNAQALRSTWYAQFRALEKKKHYPKFVGKILNQHQ